MRYVLLTLAVLSLAFGPPFPKPPPEPSKDPGIEFRMENKRYHEVFWWLRKQTGKGVRSCSPSGTFTFVGPKGARYSIPQIVEIINRSLAQKGFRLVEQERHFSLLHSWE